MVFAARSWRFPNPSAQPIDGDVGTGTIVGQTPAIRFALEQVQQVAGTDSTVLPLDAQPMIRQQFKRLIEARISAYETRFDPASADRDLELFTETQDKIWSLAVAATAPSKEVALLVLPPITEMIDVGTAKTVALQAHLSTLILGLLVGAALMSGLLAGYAMAKRRHRSWFHVIAYAAIIALTVYTVIDLDHPRFGLINIDAATSHSSSCVMRSNSPARASGDISTIDHVALLRPVTHSERRSDVIGRQMLPSSPW